MITSTLPAIPAASSLTPATIAEHGATLIAWADGVDDLAAVRDVSSKWAAITEYVRRTSREGVAEAETVLRKLEQRIGVLLGPAIVGAHHSVTTEGADIDKDARSEFRLMAEHPDIVDAVIAESDDASPPSRRKVIGAIRDFHNRKHLDDELAEAQEHAPALRAAIAALPDETRHYLVTIRIKAHPDFIDRHLPIGFDVVNIQEETP
jgi:hypothetical protein